MPCIPDSHPHSVTNNKCRIYTVISPDDGRIVARNMWRKEINIIRKILHKVGFIYKPKLNFQGSRSRQNKKEKNKIILTRTHKTQLHFIPMYFNRNAPVISHKHITV